MKRRSTSRALGSVLVCCLAATGCWRSDRDAVADFLKNRRFLREADDYVIWDEIAGHVHKAHARRVVIWKEHAARRFLMTTNNLGLREDQDTPMRKPPGEIRVLVTGDSHTDGVVPNSESFANLLEADLNSRLEGMTFNVLNAGVAHYGPYHYPRLLQKFAELKPDLFIVTFYLGNDFLDACRFLEGTGRMKNSRPRRYHQALQSYIKKSGNLGTASQGINQLYYFKHFPHMVEAALEFSEVQFRLLQRSSERLEIPVIVLLLPSKVDLEAHLLNREFQLAQEILDLNAQDLALERELARHFASRLQSLGLESLDLSTELSRSNHELFWKRDHHLNTAGHAAVAKILADHYHSQLEALAGNPQSFALEQQPVSP